jgi:putative restriction endonuclease
MSRWREVVRWELHRFREQTGHDVIERQNLLAQARPVLEREFPDANTPGQTLSRVLQELRTRDEVAFLDHEGTYRILELDSDPPDPTAPESEGRYEATTYETTIDARSIPTAFRDAVLSWYDRRCPVSGTDHAGLLDVAHVLSWSDHPERRTDPGNVLPLDRTHHAAFDRGLFTIDADCRLRVDPDLSTDSDILRASLIQQDGERLSIPGPQRPSGELLREHNESIEWL